MWFKKKLDERPLGVPLDQLQLGLGATTLKCKRAGDSLVVSHEHFSTIVSVLSPEAHESTTGPIQAVVQISTALPAEMAAHFQGPIGLVNRFAATGALTADGGRRFVGARLTIYEGECGADNQDVWNLHAQLLLVAITGNAPWTDKAQMPDGTLKNLIEHFSKHPLSLTSVPEDELGNGW